MAPPVQPTPEPLPNQEGRHEDGAANQPSIEGIRRRINWLTVLNVLVALSTIGQTVFSWRALELTQKANEMTQDALNLTRRLERAEIVVEDISRLSLSSSNPYEGVFVRIRNVGRGSAQTVEVLTRPTRPVELRKRTQLPCDRWAGNGMLSSALGPGQDVSFTTAPIKLLPDGSYYIYQRRATMYLWFKIRYVDAVGEAERTSCYAITGTGHAPRLPPTTPWRRCLPEDFVPNARTKCEEP